MTTEQQTQKTGLSAKEIIAFLVQHFPACFAQEAAQIKPLKKGIFQDLAAALEGNEQVSKTLLRQALRVYTRGWRYLSACQAGVARVGLNGEPDGVVSVEEAEHAQAEFNAAKAAYAEKLKAQRQAERQAQNKARNAKRKPRVETPKASAESLAALADKFGRK